MSSSRPSSDAVKAQAAALDAPEFETTAFTSPPPLAECTVALVTSASLHHPEQEEFALGDTSFRRLDPSRSDYQLVTGASTAGAIGKISDAHLACAGNQFEVSGIRTRPLGGS